MESDDKPAGLKPGTKTTEFWIAIAPVALGIIEGSKDDPEIKKYVIICGSALGAVYILCRTLIKWKACP
jgi:hypothetical protein